jgi:hypothetical protein
MSPLVTVIIPTTHDRVHFNEAILNNFIRQDYIKKQVLFDYSQECIGKKRNDLCKRAMGEIIVHFDSDDIFSPNWISKSVEALLESEADIVGLSNFNFYDYEQDRAYEYNHRSNPVRYLSGATLCYWKRYWETTNFVNIQSGEDSGFMYEKAKKLAKLFDHKYKEGFLASIHPGNTCRRIIDNAVNYRMCAEEEKEEIKKRFGIISHRSD